MIYSVTKKKKYLTIKYNDGHETILIIYVQSVSSISERVIYSSNMLLSFENSNIIYLNNNNSCVTVIST